MADGFLSDQELVRVLGHIRVGLMDGGEYARKLEDHMVALRADRDACIATGVANELEVRRQLVRAEADRDALVAALEFYADLEGSWSTPEQRGPFSLTPANWDKGARAREVLGRVGQPLDEGESGRGAVTPPAPRAGQGGSPSSSGGGQPG